MFSGVESKNLPLMWPMARPWIEKGLRRRGWGNWTADDVYEALRERRFQLWVEIRDDRVTGAGLTRKDRGPRYFTVNVVLWAARLGWLASARSCLGAVEKWATEIGAAAVIIEGRKGWIRVASDYQVSHVILRKELRDDVLERPAADIPRYIRGWRRGLDDKHGDRQQRTAGHHQAVP